MSEARAPAAEAAAQVACPYCTEKIAASAIVCKHCHRDLIFFMPLRRDIDALKARVESLETQNKRLTALLLGDDAEGKASVAAALAPCHPRPSGLAAPGVFAIVLFLLLPVLLLVGAHALIVMWLDLSEIYLRIVAALLPLCIAFVLSARLACGWHGSGSWPWSSAYRR